MNGRHNRAAGFNADLEKYLEAGLAGWRVFRLGPDQITMENVGRLVSVLSVQPHFERRRSDSASTLKDMSDAGEDK